MRPWLVCLAVLAPPTVLLAQVPLGPQFQVNAYTHRQQRVLDVASDGLGRFVVVWQRDGEYYNGEGIFGQRFDDAARPLGVEFRVSTPGQDVSQADAPALAMAADGRFVVAWGGDVFYPGIWFRRYAANGTALAPPARVDDPPLLLSRYANVAMDASGSFVVVWMDRESDGYGYGVMAQRFNASGSRLGVPFQVNTYTTGDQTWPSLAVAPSGAFMVVWNSSQPGGDLTDVWGRRYDAQGQPLTGEFLVNSFTTGFQFIAHASTDAAGRTVVVWDDAQRHAIPIRRYAADGSPIGAEVTISSGPPYGSPSEGQMAVEAGGGFEVAWWGDDRQIFAQRFSAAGVPGPVLRVSHQPAEFGVSPRLAALGFNRGFVAAWAPEDLLQPQALLARRYADVGPLALAVDGVAGSGSDGNGVLEMGESVLVAPTWINTNSSPQTATGTASQFTGPGAATLYILLDAAASYGSLPPGVERSCMATGDCYRAAVGAPATRPAAHWDARLREDIAGGASVPAVTWTLHVGDSFSDVARTSVYYRFVETLLHNGVTTGCGGSVYCPLDAVPREQMAVFVLAAREGLGYAPRTCLEGNQQFPDVPFDSPYCSWIEELYDRQVVAGCGNGLFCPAAPVTREQMAVFVLRTLDPLLEPPACTTPVFADVPASSPFCRWIEELARRGVVTGCGGGNYCPAAAVSREQMSVFITATFGLTLYGP